MKKVVFLLLFAAMPFVVSAQDEAAADKPASNWTKGGNTSLTFNQISFKNWAAGGKNSVTGTFLFKTFANYKTEMQTWDNTLDLGYGMTKYKDEDLQKSEDKIMLSSTYGYNAYKQKLYYSANADFKSQFTKGYKYTATDTIYVSEAFAPAYINLSLGLLYKPNDVFSLFVSPVTGHLTIVNDTTLSTSYGVDANKKLRSEYGASAKLNINKKDIVKNVDFDLRADFFSNLCDNPQHIDVDAETGLNFTINKFLSSYIKCNFLFDDDIKYKESYIDADGNSAIRDRGARLQFKELFGFGISFKW